MNQFQRIAYDAYDSVLMKELEDIDPTRPIVEQLQEYGDTLFTFIMVELSTSEGCNTADEAVRRLDTAIRQLEAVRDAIDTHANQGQRR